MKMEGMSLGVIGRTEDMSQEDKREQEKDREATTKDTYSVRNM